MVAEQTRLRGLLESLQQHDAEIDQIVYYSKFVVAYFLKQDGDNPGWIKPGIEGPVYLVKRRVNPKYQVMVKNQFNQTDLLDSLHPEWELDCQKNYVFYKVEDPTKLIRGLWFHDESERVRIEATLEKTLEEVQASRRAGVDQSIPAPRMGPETVPPSCSGCGAAPGCGGSSDVAGQSAAVMQGGGAPETDVDPMYAQKYGMKPNDGERISVTMTSLSQAFHLLADDENFLKLVMQKLKGLQFQ